MSLSMWQTLRQWLGSRQDAQPQAAPLSPLPPQQRHELQQRLAQLRPFAQPGAQPLATQALVVFDLETTGLDRQRDSVLSIGAVRIQACGAQPGIALGHSFARVLKVPVPISPLGQLFHGLTQGDLSQGQDPRLALLELLEWGQDALWLAWHAWFDQAMLHRAAQQWLGEHAPSSRTGKMLLPLPGVCDLAQLLPALLGPCPTALQADMPDKAPVISGDHDLDAWLQALGLAHSARHDAVADAMATAELALIALAHAQAQGLQTWGQLASLASQREREQQQPGF
ncbi:DNA polymerase III subunit epsilon [Vandammella animalimorsus]|uniref:DNA polymerase III subunit epsilon n=2 Tax=Vandammella animalimorsus TaxID=2029117 RepID=A0A2A2AXA3_9BURK|nr:DNA polymerase III subunit epsilon [Vandammella animalimorsus]